MSKIKTVPLRYDYETWESFRNLKDYFLSKNWEEFFIELAAIYTEGFDIESEIVKRREIEAIKDRRNESKRTIRQKNWNKKMQKQAIEVPVEEVNNEEETYDEPMIEDNEEIEETPEERKKVKKLINWEEDDE